MNSIKKLKELKATRELIDWFRKEKVECENDGGASSDNFSQLKVIHNEEGYGVIYTGKTKVFRGNSEYNSDNTILSIPSYLFLSYEKLVRQSVFFDFLGKIRIDNEYYKLMVNGRDLLETEIKKQWKTEIPKTIEEEKQEEELKITKNWKWGGNVADEIILTMFLTYCKNNENDEEIKELDLYPYIKQLCELEAEEQGNYEEIKENHYVYISKVIETIYKNIDDKETRAKFPNPITEEGKKLFQDAYVLVKTRSTGPINEETKEPNNPLLVPYFDLFNHKNKNRQEGGEVKSFDIVHVPLIPNYDKSPTEEVLITLKEGEWIELKEGDQIFIDYGIKQGKHYGELKNIEVSKNYFDYELNKVISELESELKEIKEEIEIPPKK